MGSKENDANSAVDGITALDADAKTLREFATGSTTPVPYDETLKKYAGDESNDESKPFLLQTVSEMGADVEDGDYVKTHYGDWPEKQTQVINPS